jgi:hypothetical protein
MPFRTALYDPSDDVLKAIGKSVVAWNNLEESMQGVIWRAYSLDSAISAGEKQPFGEILTSRMGFRMKLDVIASLCAVMLGKPRQEELNKTLFAELRDLETERNVIAHGIWFAHNQTGAPFHVKAFKKQLRKDVHYEVTIEDLAGFFDRAKAFTALLDDLFPA